MMQIRTIIKRLTASAERSHKLGYLGDEASIYWKIQVLLLLKDISKKLGKRR